MKDIDLNQVQFRRIELYASRVKKKYLAAMRKLIELANETSIDASKPFRFEDYPDLNRAAKRVFKQLNDEIKETIINGIGEEWNESNKLNDQRVEEVFKFKKIGKIQRSISNATLLPGMLLLPVNLVKAG